jgi:hypothetical protein
MATIDDEISSWSKFDTRLTRLEANQENMGRHVIDIAEAVDTIVRTQTTSGKTNWQVVLTGLSVLFGVVSAAATLQTAHLESRLAPLDLSQRYDEKVLDTHSVKIDNLTEQVVTIREDLVHLEKSVK